MTLQRMRWGPQSSVYEPVTHLNECSSVYLSTRVMWCLSLMCMYISVARPAFIFCASPFVFSRYRARGRSIFTPLMPARVRKHAPGNINCSRTKAMGFFSLPFAAFFSFSFSLSVYVRVVSVCMRNYSERERRFMGAFYDAERFIPGDNTFYLPAFRNEMDMHAPPAERATERWYKR